ncbi:hypothetical protein BO99DRAFT_70640 [Aspergillus violaceofuscus CBS 115571]|uniref:Uncharacterized protein n=1 Tax=Aspergillus violaceofuscus (strain CBS 115571) TaxID=1450538 RepID=A0A2V5INW6_ASPV1|nr:hypothetical protein BO99DRAFT_70640 [Aspergillus violaceofuscus CBS 115571]
MWSARTSSLVRRQPVQSILRLAVPKSVGMTVEASGSAPDSELAKPLQSIIISTNLAGKSSRDAASIIVVVHVPWNTPSDTNASRAASKDAAVVGNTRLVRLTSSRLHITLQTVRLTETGLLGHVVDAQTSKADTPLIGALPVDDAARDIRLGGCDRLPSNTRGTLHPVSIGSATAWEGRPRVGKVLEHTKG